MALVFMASLTIIYPDYDAFTPTTTLSRTIILSFTCVIAVDIVIDNKLSLEFKSAITVLL